MINKDFKVMLVYRIVFGGIGLYGLFHLSKGLETAVKMPIKTTLSCHKDNQIGQVEIQHFMNPPEKVQFSLSDVSKIYVQGPYAGVSQQNAYRVEILLKGLHHKPLYISYLPAEAKQLKSFIDESDKATLLVTAPISANQKYFLFLLLASTSFLSVLAFAALWIVERKCA